MKKPAEYGVVVVATLVALAIGIGAFAWSGAYNIGADAHHWPLTYDFLTMARNRSLAAHAKDIQVPNLEAPQLILKGAGQYSAMCTQCHLRPGVENSEQRVGMYPLPPDLSRVHIPPKVAFWAIKHGIKMSGMPAWGLAGHDDETIWSMVAFIEKLPGMTPAEYKAIVAKAPPDEDMDMDSSHMHAPAHGASAGTVVPSSGMASMHGTTMPAHAETSARR